MSSLYNAADTRNIMLDAAIDYTRRGWAVLPIVCRDKRPLTSHGLSDATTDAEQVNQWWMKHPEANVGIRTGPESGIFMLGPDGEQGIQDLQALEDLHGALPKTATIRSGSGGRHYYFRWPSDGLTISNRSNYRGTKIDVRGAGGYAVAPPSMNENGTYEWIDDVEPAESPAWLLGWIRNDGKPPRPNPSPRPPSPLSGNASDVYARAPEVFGEDGTGRLRARRT